LKEIVESRSISPDFLRTQLSGCFDFNFTRNEIYTLLQYILSDLNGSSNFMQLHKIPLLLLQNKLCCSFDHSDNENSKFLLTASLKQYYPDILPGIEDSIVDTTLPASLQTLFEEIALSGSTQIKLADSKANIKVLFEKSIFKWLTTQPPLYWCPGQGMHPEELWMKSVWKWIQEQDESLECIVGLPLIPQVSSNTDKGIELVSHATNASYCCLPSSMIEQKWCSLLKRFQMIVVEKRFTCKVFPELDQQLLLKKLCTMKRSTSY